MHVTLQREMTQVVNPPKLYIFPSSQQSISHLTPINETASRHAGSYAVGPKAEPLINTEYAWQWIYRSAKDITHSEPAVKVPSESGVCTNSTVESNSRAHGHARGFVPELWTRPTPLRFILSGLKPLSFGMLARTKPSIKWKASWQNLG